MRNLLHEQAKTTPKDFFLWIGVMVTLYLSTISLVMLLFEYVNILFPDPLVTYVDPYRGAIRFAIANLIVVFPLYVYLTRKVNTDARKNPGKYEIKVRKWLLFLTLFAAALTVVIDLIILINTFLGGELTSPFIIKVAIILLVIGGVFIYYLYDIRGYWQVHERTSKTVGAVVAAIILASIVSGFLIMGSPTTQRLLRFDQQKVNDLTSIQWQIINFYQSKGALPANLLLTEDTISGFRIPTDSQTGDAYVFEQTGDLTFNLCATFNLKSPDVDREAPSRAKYGFGDDNWEHEAGEYCFERTIDPDLYPVYNHVAN